MIRINLLPDEFAAERRWKSAQIKVILMSLLLTAFFAAMGTRLYLVNRNTFNMLADLADMRLAVEREIAGFSSAGELQKEIKSLEKLLVRVMGGSPDWCNILNSLDYHLPKKVRLKSIKLAFDGLQGDITMRGEAESNIVMAEWVNALQRITDLNSVQIIYSAKKEGAAATVQFEISAAVAAGTAVPLAEAE